MENNTPEWFDPKLLPLLEKKLDRSKMKRSERNLDWVVRQFLKALPSKLTGLTTKKFSWKDIEWIIEENCNSIDYKPDVVIGIKSGGAFIANYVALCLDVNEVDYMHISHYSDVSQSAVKATLNQHKKEAVIKEEPKLSVIGKKVLLVDDQTATGSTLKVGKKYFLDKGVLDVKTFCLYSKKPKVDFCTRKCLMVYTPWGKDA